MQNIQFGHFALRLIAERVGHNYAAVVLNLVESVLAARWANKHQYAVVENLQHAACLVVTILAVDIVLLELICAIGVDSEHGLDARAVGSRQCALVCAGNGSEVYAFGSCCVSYACRIGVRFVLCGVLAIARHHQCCSQECSVHKISFHIFFLLTIICGAKLRIYNQILSVGVFKSSKKILGNGKFPKGRLLQKIEQGERNILAIPLLTYINKA